MYTLYDYLDSGNGYKIRLLLSQLQIGYRYVEADIMRGETRTRDFLLRNPNGRIPVLEIEPGVHLAESNAILWYLAEGSALAPASRWARAQTLQWMFFEQYSHEPYVAVARFWLAYAAPEDFASRKHLLPEWHAKGNAALGVMDAHLKTHDWLAGGRYSVADIALYGYTHCAGEGGFDLAVFPALSRWLGRVASQPGHIPLSESW